jgi:hypothetical protein
VIAITRITQARHTGCTAWTGIVHVTGTAPRFVGVVFTDPQGTTAGEAIGEDGFDDLGELLSRVQQFRTLATNRRTADPQEGSRSAIEASFRHGNDALYSVQAKIAGARMKRGAIRPE